MNKKQNVQLFGDLVFKVFKTFIFNFYLTIMYLIIIIVVIFD